MIPNNIVSIGEEAFSGCGKLEITIPDSVMSIGEDAFKGCKSVIRECKNRIPVETVKNSESEVQSESVENAEKKLQPEIVKITEKEVQANSTVKKKGGFFSRLFGRKNKE